MPTIAQLPTAASVTAQDEIPLSQAGTTRSVSVGELLASTQPAIVAETGALLGRVSLGPGGPEPVVVGLGLALSAGMLAADGADHAGFPERGSLSSADQLVLSSGGAPALLPVEALRGLFSAGANVTIDASGVIAASGSGIGTGPAGPAGPAGPVGPAGADGEAGPSGPAGPAGPAIASGAVDPSGRLSLVRSDGASIAVSGFLTGPAGPPGAVGLPGPSGPPGAAGEPGATGPAGPFVSAGSVSPSGALSLTRSDGGVVAVSGSFIGPAGPAGPAGAAGAQGIAGPAGPQGPAGLSGGAGAVINSGTVSPTGALSLVRSDGTTIAVAGTIVGATGPQGPIGNPGPAGAAGPAGATGPAGAAGPAGPVINSGTVVSGALSLIRSDGTTIAVAGSIVGPAGAAGSTGPAGATGSTGPAGATGPAGSSVTITTLASTGTIASADLVGISQGGTDHSISYASFLAGETGDQLPAAAPVSGTDTFLTLQGGSSTLTQPASALWAWLAASQIRTYKRPVVELNGAVASVGIDGSAHNGCDLVVSGGTVTLAPLATMGSGFECRVFNVSGAPVTLSGFTVSNAGTTLPTGTACLIDAIAYSGGTLNFANVGGAVTAIVAPGQVTGLASGAITSSSVALSWAVPASGGSPSSYTVNVAPHGSSSFVGTSVAGTTATVTGLSASTSYDFEVIAVNAAGSGAASAIVTASTIAAPTQAPGPVTSLAAGTPTSSAVPLSWSAPTTGGAVSSYTVGYRVTGGGAFTTFASGLSATSATVTGLSPATGYDFQVLSVNGVGQGSATVSATTGAALALPGQPGTPTVGTVTATTVPLSWTAPASGGAVATYAVQQSPHGAGTFANCAGGTGLTGTSFTATGLSSGTAYDFQVVASNATGSGTPSGAATATTSAFAPNTPAGFAAGAPTSTTVPLSWTASAVDGSHSAASSYTVQYRVTSVGGAFTQVTGITGTSTTVTGLSASTQYDFQVAAVNAAGPSGFTATTNATTAALGTYLLTQGQTSQPTLGGSYSHTATVGINVNDNSTSGDGSHTLPTGVSVGLSTSNTVPPSGGALQAASGFSNGGHHYWSCYYSATSLSPGAYYVWGIAYASGTQVATYTSASTITLT